MCFGGGPADAIIEVWAWVVVGILMERGGCFGGGYGAICRRAGGR